MNSTAKSKKRQRMAQSVASQAVLCLFCRTELPKSSQQRIIIPASTSIQPIDEFLSDFVTPALGETSRSNRESDPHGEKVRTCKPCFNKLEKGLKGLDTVKEAIDEFRV